MCPSSRICVLSCIKPPQNIVVVNGYFGHHLHQSPKILLQKLTSLFRADLDLNRTENGNNWLLESISFSRFTGKGCLPVQSFRVTTFVVQPFCSMQNVSCHRLKGKQGLFSIFGGRNICFCNMGTFVWAVAICVFLKLIWITFLPMAQKVGQIIHSFSNFIMTSLIFPEESRHSSMGQ